MAHRDNGRLLVKSPELAEKIWSRVKGYVPCTTDGGCVAPVFPCETHVELLLTLFRVAVGVNTDVRFYRYNPGYLDAMSCSDHCTFSDCTVQTKLRQAHR